MMIYLLMVHFLLHLNLVIKYLLFITITYAKELDSFYTTSFAILQNKEQEIYKIFKKLKKKKNANTCNNNIIIAESIVI